MQDKEFDDLFRSKLENFESEPSEKVWMNVDTGLHKKPRNRALLPLLRIAAGIVIVLTAGLLFMTRKSNDNSVQHNHHTQVAGVQAIKPALEDNKNIPVGTNTVKDEITAADRQVVHHKKREHHVTKEEQPVPQKISPDKMIAKTEPEKTDQQPLTVTQVKPQEIVQQKAEQPVNAIASNNIQTGTPEVTANETKPVPAVTGPETAKPNTRAVKRHGIHNVGDLVNLVMAKVDKRKDKALEFTDDDDGSTLTAVNIGPIRISRADKDEK